MTLKLNRSLLITLLSICAAAGVCSGAQSTPTLVKAPSSAAVAGLFGVPGIEQEICGEGTLVDIRLDGCSTTPCTLNIGQSYTLQVDFKSLRHHWIMILRSVILKLGPNPERHVIVGDVAIHDSILEENTEYTFTFPMTIPTGFTGASELRLKLYENFDYQHELCITIPLNLV